MTREEATEWLIQIKDKYIHDGDEQFDTKRKEALDMAIEALKSDRPKGEWIPCSERLPEENEVVLTQARFADDIKMAVSARIDYNYWTGWGTREVNVVAWMPLPAPYMTADD